MFEASYQDLSPDRPEWGRVAILPWDQEIFGFPVGDYQAGDVRQIAGSREEFQATLSGWAERFGVELVGSSVAADDVLWCTLLPELGFAFVDYTLKIAQPRLQAWVPTAAKLPVRLAQPVDKTSVELIAQHAFRAGRYHRDPRFPRSLSDLRYKHWLGNTFSASSPFSRLYVTGDEGKATSFFHVNLSDDEAYITIIAVAPEKQGGRTSVDLCTGVLIDLKSMGIRRMSSKISAMNSGVMNLAVFFGWRFSDPQSVFHWHSRNAPHLVQPEEVFSLEVAP